jgi:hypothetical protein
MNREIDCPITEARNGTGRNGPAQKKPPGQTPGGGGCQECDGFRQRDAGGASSRFFSGMVPWRAYSSMIRVTVGFCSSGFSPSRAITWSVV